MFEPILCPYSQTVRAVFSNQLFIDLQGICKIFFLMTVDPKWWPVLTSPKLKKYLYSMFFIHQPNLSSHNNLKQSLIKVIYLACNLVHNCAVTYHCLKLQHWLSDQTMMDWCIRWAKCPAYNANNVRLETSLFSCCLVTLFNSFIMCSHFKHTCCLTLAINSGLIFDIVHCSVTLLSLTGCQQVRGR